MCASPLASHRARALRRSRLAAIGHLARHRVSISLFAVLPMLLMLGIGAASASALHARTMSLSEMVASNSLLSSLWNSSWSGNGGSNCFGGGNNDNNHNGDDDNNSNSNCNEHDNNDDDNNNNDDSDDNNDNNGNCNVVKNFCHKCPKAVGSITIFKSANHGCVVSAGGSINYTYVVANTGGLTVNSIAVTDSVLGSIGAIPTLAGGASATLTKTVTLNAASTNTSTAAGKNSSNNTVAATSNSVTVKLSHPAISVSASASPTIVTTGQTTTISYVVTNTRDDTINGITVTDSVWGNIGTVSLAAGASQTLTKVITPTVGDTTSNITISGTSPCSDATVTASSSVKVTSSKPGLTITATIPHGCIPATGGSIAYTYTVTNTGNAPLTGVAISDSVLGIADTIANLAAGASVTDTDTIALTGALIATADPGGTITTNTTATGTDSVTTLTVAASTPASVTLNVIHPTLSLKITPPSGPLNLGDTIAFTYTVTNTGDIAINNITVFDGSGNPVGAISSLAVGASQSFPVNVTATSTALTVSGTARGVDSCGGSPATASDTTTRTADDTPAVRVVGATVNLTDSHGIVFTTTTDSNGNYEFDDASDDTYTVQVTMSDHSPGASSAFTYSHIGGDTTVPTIGLAALPINYTEQLSLGGAIEFSDVQPYQDAQGGAIDADTNPQALYDTSLNPNISYYYIGVIPTFPSLGHFGLPGEPKVWVYIDPPLLPEDRWDSNSLTNRIAVDAGLGTGAGRPPTPFNISVLFNHPFVGTGTAYNYTIQNMKVNLLPIPITDMDLQPLEHTDGTAGALSGNDIPAGWMARTRFFFQVPAQTTFAMSANGTYQDVCGDVFNFSIHPDSPGTRR